MFGWLRTKAGRRRALAKIDLVPVRGALMRKLGWSHEKAVEAERAYRGFLALMIDWPKERHVPTAEVDAFWHAHVLDTRKYEADCKAVFGRTIHHDPNFRRGTPEHAETFERTRSRLTSVPGAQPRAKTIREGDGVSVPADCGTSDPVRLAVIMMAGGGAEKPAPAHEPPHAPPAAAKSLAAEAPETDASDGSSSSGDAASCSSGRSVGGD